VIITNKLRIFLAALMVAVVGSPALAGGGGFTFTGSELAGINTSVGLVLAAGAVIALLYVGYKHFRRGTSRA
jgi:membrane protein implicated in regulation of membrane protease activity